MPTHKAPSTLSGHAAEIWISAFNGAYEGTCKSRDDRDACAARIAWSAVKQKYSKGSDGNWSPKAEVAEFSMAITKASYDKASGARRWRAVASDTDEDSFGDNMSLELFNDFLHRIETNESPPPSFRSEFWSGGKPYISVSHYPDLDGKGVPGTVDSVYVDGNRLKATGRFDDTPIGRACFEAVCKDLYDTENPVPEDAKVRISIAFLDWKHKHKSNGSIFERNNDVPICFECIKSLLNGNIDGKEFLSGHLVHLALTRVPVNKRTSMEVERSMTTRKEDAASIIGDELADELEEEAGLIGKSEALVIKADEDELVEEAQHMETDDEMDNDEAEEECTDENGQVDEDCLARKKEKKQQKAELIEQVPEELVEEAAVTKKEAWGSESMGSYLVHEDSSKPTTWHLPVKKNGKPDRGLAGAAWAALFSPGGHRGKQYAGPGKDEAKRKLRALYKAQGWELPGEKKAILDVLEEIRSGVAKWPDEPHPLDESFSKIRETYDLVMESEIVSLEDAMETLRNPFEALGEAIRNSIMKSTAETPSDVVPEVNTVLVDALSELRQELGLLRAEITSLKQSPTKPVTNPIPVRRSVDPAVLGTMKSEPKRSSITEIVRKSVGLPD